MIFPNFVFFIIKINKNLFLSKYFNKNDKNKYKNAITF